MTSLPGVTTVEESFSEQEAQCLGLNVPVFCWSWLESKGEPEHPFYYCHGVSRLTIEYKIRGPGGGTWTLGVDMDDCRMSRAVASGPHAVTQALSEESPHIIVQASSTDWLRLWSGQESVWSLIGSGRLTARDADNSELDRTMLHHLPFLGVLGPLPDLDKDLVARRCATAYRFYRAREVLWVGASVGILAAIVLGQAWGWRWMLAGWAVVALAIFAVRSRLNNVLDRLGQERRKWSGEF